MSLIRRRSTMAMRHGSRNVKKNKVDQVELDDSKPTAIDKGPSLEKSEKGPNSKS